MKCILTSYIDLYDKDENGNRLPKNFGNDNKILDNIKNYVKNYHIFPFVTKQLVVGVVIVQS